MVQDNLKSYLQNQTGCIISFEIRKFKFAQQAQEVIRNNFNDLFKEEDGKQMQMLFRFWEKDKEFTDKFKITRARYRAQINNKNNNINDNSRYTMNQYTPHQRIQKIQESKQQSNKNREPDIRRRVQQPLVPKSSIEHAKTNNIQRIKQKIDFTV
eukprot:UN31731